MSRILRLRDGKTHWVTNEQADKILQQINAGVRMIRITTAGGYLDVNPAAIDYMSKASGESYISEPELIAKQKEAERMELEARKRSGASGRITSGQPETIRALMSGRRIVDNSGKKSA